MADLEHLHPAFRADVERALADYPGAYVLSGARSNARQWELWNDAQAGSGNPANYPGTSWHEYDERAPWPRVDAEYAAATHLTGGPWALAVDLAGSYAGILRNADAYGLCFPIAGEDWHAQPAAITEVRRTAGAWRWLQLPGPPPPPTPPPDPWAGLFVPILTN